MHVSSKGGKFCLGCPLGHPRADGEGWKSVVTRTVVRGRRLLFDTATRAAIPAAATRVLQTTPSL